MRIKIAITLFLLALCTVVSAQSIESLQEQIRRAEEEIKANTVLLEKNRKDQKLSQTQLKLIQSRINSRKKIVNSLESQIVLINRDINSKSSTVTSLGSQLKKLKADYAKMIYAAYKNYRVNNFLLLLFSSRDFNDASARIYIMKRYNKLREEKATQIDSLSLRIKGQITQLSQKEEQLKSTKQSRTQELDALGKDEGQYKTSVASLKASASKISTTLKERQRQIAKAQQQIQSIIAEEARKNKGMTGEKERENIALTGRFDQNMGKLPMPVRGGVVIDEYGIHEHQTQKGLKVNNRGINIATPKGAEVRSVFDGVVTRIFFVQGLNNNVMVRHGDFITVYSNLASVAVKTGDKVSLNQKLGNVSSSSDSEEHMLHFEIWKETNNLNPSSWLAR